LVLAMVVMAIAVIFFPSAPAAAAPDKCDPGEWAKNPSKCLNRLDPVSDALADCMGVPTPDEPDSGAGGWFASDPKVTKGRLGYYSTYGYSGYSYPIYNPDCTKTSTVLPTGADATTTIANGELMVATSIIGAANGFRDRAYNPSTMWGWADPLVKTATKGVYQKVFSVFGVITIAVVGLYLLWRSRQANMNDALTTAGWAILVMVVVTAVATWPLVSAHLADSTLVSSLGLIHSAVGPQQRPLEYKGCPFAWPKDQRPPNVPYDPARCKDNRSASVIASDTATESVLYNNWLRGTLGSTTSTTATEYGPSLYKASSLSWAEHNKIYKAEHPPNHAQPNMAVRKQIYAQKADDFRRIANQIRTQDPNAYSYLSGKQGTSRMGAGLIAVVSALGFAFFDIAASLLIILGFLIFRWAVVALPVIGTIAILRPASAGFKRLINIVVAAIFNIVVFGAGASVYLFAVDIIMTTQSLPGWLQLTLIWLSGVVGWLLLRPFRRITQLGGKSPIGEIAHIGSWHKRFFSDLKGVAIGAAGAAALGDIEAQDDGEEQKGKRRRGKPTEAGGDGQQPATPGAVPDAPSSKPDPNGAPPDPGQSPESPRTPEPAGTPSGGSSRRDSQVWVPATGRYADGSDTYDDLSAGVGRDTSTTPTTGQHPELREREHV
jgi:hypothetical protein